MQKRTTKLDSAALFCGLAHLTLTPGSSKKKLHGERKHRGQVNWVKLGDLQQLVPSYK